MSVYLPYSDPPSDYENIRINGMWYQEWQGGYHDILKRGYPRPKYKTTILAELHSPVIVDFLHGGATDVPFLVSARAQAVIRKNQLRGIKFSAVEIAKIATKGIKAEDQSREVDLPKLYAARVVGRFEIIPDYPSGRCPGIGYVTPYDFHSDREMPDLWRPTIRGRTFASWTYCSERFRKVVEEQGLSNIGFEPFEEHMCRFRKDVLSQPT
jgi:hypothetical protein